MKYLVKQVVMVLASTVWGFFLGFVLFKALDKDRASVKEVSVLAKTEPMVEIKEGPSTLPIGELFSKSDGISAVPRGQGILTNEWEAGSKGYIRAEPKVPASE